jgi:hypothetical protein
MKKIETIWHHILHTALTEQKYKHTQQELAKIFGYSLSTVHHALQIPAAIGAVRKESKFFVLQDFQKLLIYAASMRSLERDILAHIGSVLSVREIEGLALPGSIYGGYTAARQLLSEPPADYDKVYFYVARSDLQRFRERFGAEDSRTANIYALSMPLSLACYGAQTTLVQTFIDVWNLRDWYARDFSQALERRIDELLP